LGKHANFAYVADTINVVTSGSTEVIHCAVIRDLGPWNEHLTVTNDVEWVVKQLFATHALLAGQRLFYYDSDGRLDEILVKDGKFVAFAAGPQE